jgi:hypothetical protein
MYLQRKNQHCIFIVSVLFCSETETRYTLCTGGPSLGAKSGLPDDLTQNMIPVTPPGNGNVGRGTRAPSESGFKVGENLTPEQSVTGEILRKE